ncbi:hypothetical protein [Actinoallomurus iriomotensis]|uniref:Uncharacterized protein n=1 Tax=Actinoallomurus iriomotensis TaxID=478107 RepID=A0A9W6RPM3_9ACTN|nr:hypothetical protein [Actinoallomurus iriomotensis]GLY80141.1 hypothetical protein Airi01_084080 [Actinoallomurus iriomotensis]
MRTVVIGPPGAGKTALCALGVDRIRRSGLPLRLADRAGQTAWRRLRGRSARGSTTPSDQITAWFWQIRGPALPAQGAARLNWRARRTWGTLEIVDVPGSLVVSTPAGTATGLLRAHLSSADTVVIVLRADSGPLDHTTLRHLVGHLQAAEPSVRRDIVVAVTGVDGDDEAARLDQTVAPLATYLGALRRLSHSTVTVLPVRPRGRRRSRNVAVPFLPSLARVSPIRPRYVARAEHVLRQATDTEHVAWRPRRYNVKTSRLLSGKAFRYVDDCRVTVLGVPGSGRSGLVYGLFRALGPELPLWLHAPDLGVFHDLISGGRRRGAGARTDWCFEVVDGAHPLVEIDWREVDAPRSDPSAEVPERGDPAATDLVRESDCVIVTIRAEHVEIPVSPERSGEIRDLTGMRIASVAMDATVAYRAATERPPPLFVLVVTHADILDRTRTGLIDDLRLLVPAAFGPDALAIVTTVAGPEEGLVRGVTGLAHALLIAALTKNMTASRDARRGALEEQERHLAEVERIQNSGALTRLFSWSKKRRSQNAANASGVEASAAESAGASAWDFLTRTISDLPGMTLLQSGQPLDGPPNPPPAAAVSE